MAGTSTPLALRWLVKRRTSDSRVAHHDGCAFGLSRAHVTASSMVNVCV
jgi:hypothetical protein